MNHVLITGMSGVGKTTAVTELRRRRFACIDMDGTEWAYIGPDGHQHWNVERLEAAMDGAENESLFVSGCAAEQVTFYHRFGEIILLSVSREVMIQRILSRTDNSFGQRPSEMNRIL